MYMEWYESTWNAYNDFMKSHYKKQVARGHQKADSLYSICGSIAIAAVADICFIAVVSFQLVLP